ncbi:MAG: hypothetical protein ABIH34_01810 [Nanoarchaeota archaeon]
MPNVPIDYTDEDIIRLFKKKKLTSEQIAKVYGINHNVVKRVLLDHGVKLDDMNDMIGTYADYKVNHQKHRTTMFVGILVIIFVGIGFLSFFQEGTLLGKNRATGYVVNPPGLPPCPHECCVDAWHESKTCAEGMECIDWRCHPEGTEVDAES